MKIREHNSKGSRFPNRGVLIPVLILLLLLVPTGCQEQRAPKETSRIGYLKAAEEQYFYFNEILWVTLEDTATIERLGLDPNADMPGGFYIHDKQIEWEVFDPGESVVYRILDPYPDSRAVARPLFRNRLDERGEMLVRIHYSDGVSSAIEEQYLP